MAVPLRPDAVKILVVGDQPAKLLTYDAILTELGEELIRANSAREALEALLKHEIAVVLADVCMPDLDGYELAAMIRQHPRCQKTAIIFVSAVHLTDLDRLRGYESGAVDYVSVPVVPEILRAKVGVFIELYRKRQEAERLNVELEERVTLRTAELEASTERLRALSDQLREADRRKDEFLALLAHELRNPLAPLRNASQILRLKQHHDPEVLWCRDVIDRQVNQLARLVDDLLDVSRITRGKIKLQTGPVDLALVVAGAIETSRPLIDAHRHELTVSLPEAPLRVDGDLARLTQIVANLLNNAAKYQKEEGAVELLIDRDGAEATIVVKDRGVGIAPERLSQIFDLFSQEEVTIDRARGGLGIGLWLVKHLVDMHGGSVAAVSEGDDRGSEFIVRLPALEAMAVEAARADDRAVVAGLAGGPPLRVLVVDDNRDAAETLALLLQLSGQEVLLAHDGETAVAIALAERPAVILLDIGLPGLDGYEVCRALRCAGMNDTLIVAMTGYGQDKDRQRAYEAGFDSHTVKPVDSSELASLLTRAHQKTRLLASASQGD